MWLRNVVGGGEDADVAGDLVVYDEREVGGDVELRRQLGDELGIGRKGDVFGGVERGGFDLRREKPFPCLSAAISSELMRLRSAVELGRKIALRWSGPWPEVSMVSMAKSKSSRAASKRLAR